MRNIKQAATGALRLPCPHPAIRSQSVDARTPDQAWPPSAVDLLTARHYSAEKGPVLLAARPHQHATMKVLPLIVLLACVAWQARAQDDESRPAARGLLKRGPPTRGKPTTTTTTPAPQEEAEYEEDAEYAEEGQQEPSTEAPPSSTEGKKLVGSGVRPFRSNTDLLETLKRRRAQAAEAKLRAHSNSDAPPAPEAPAEPAKSSYTATRSVQPEAEEEAPAPAPVRNGRTFARRGN